MVEVKLISVDGATELNVMQNYMGQGRPGFSVRYIDDSGMLVSAEFPLEPPALGNILKILLEAQSSMLKHLFTEMSKAIAQAEEDIKAERSDASIIQFKKREF